MSVQDFTDERGVVRLRGTYAGGGSPPYVRVPLAFNTPSLAVQSFPQVSADQATSSFVVAGDHAALFPPAAALTSTSTLNSGAYTVVSSSFAAGNTTIVVVEPVADEGADGDVINAAGGVTSSGIEVYVPTDGDIWVAGLSFVSVTTVWDGTGTPTAYLYQEGAADYTNSIAVISGKDLTVPDVDETSSLSNAITLPSPFSNNTTPLKLNDATSLRLVVDDGSGGAPGSLQGAGEIALFIVPAT